MRELAGLVGGMFFAGYIVFQIPGDMFADKRGPGYAMGIGLLTSWFSNLLFTLSDPALWPYIPPISSFFAGTVYGPSMKLIRVLFQRMLRRLWASMISYGSSYS